MNSKLPPDDLAAFQEAMKNVKPLQNNKKQITFPKKISPLKKNKITKPKALVNSESIVNTEIGATDVLDFHRGGLQQKRLRQLRQGQIPYQAELDLHGLTVKQAAHALSSFMHKAFISHWRCIRIIHGKGTVDKTPRLKNHINFWLREIPEVLAFHSAPTHQGGTGAINVLLKLKTDE